MTHSKTVAGVEITAPADSRCAAVLNGEAVAFVGELHRRFDGRRRELLAARAERRHELDGGRTLDFLPQTRELRDGEWQVAPPAADLRRRRVEITGPVDRKTVVNALSCGADGFMADFEDATSPTWQNVIGGQQNLRDAIEREIDFDEDGKSYRLAERPATLLVRPRGWHLPEKHMRSGGDAIAGAFVDFGLYFHRNARRLIERGSGPFFYLPKLESHLEARLWNEVFTFAERECGIPYGTTKATVLIETVPAAFEMEEILYELRDHSAGLNAGRWDYIFSMIKCFRDRPEFVLPDRDQVTMTVPFMRAYTDLLVRTCHRRGAHAMGGMAAYIPSRRRPEVNERAIAKVRADKEREAGDGFDGTWVAHPDLVEVAMQAFDAVLDGRDNQVERQRDDVEVASAQLLDAASAGAAVTEAGLRANVAVGVAYISSWLAGRGAAAIDDLMEDAATAEIARSQVWQWVRHAVELEGGERVTAALVRRLLADSDGDQRARELFDQVALSEDFAEFLTLPAYELVD